MMQEKVKGMLKGMSMPKKKVAEKMPEGMMEGEEGEEEEAPEVEINLEDMGGEEEGMPEESSALAEVSDEELMAELKKRGIEVGSGGASITPLPPAPEEEEPAVPAKRKSV